uniref:Uncharacterized protein n=1 Tax=Rhizophora mucronata TaxID=61149 RepID=A0A2P2NUC0_RHIMU
MSDPKDSKFTSIMHSMPQTCSKELINNLFTRFIIFKFLQQGSKFSPIVHRTLRP